MRNKNDIIINNIPLNTILENHRHWLEKDCEGWENMRANLCEADLHEVDLRYVNLRDANLYGANLYRADLRNTDLSEADLRNTNLQYANLYFANLLGASLFEANLSNAKLYKTNLYSTNLRYANLRETDLYGVNLCEANLSYADLRKADLSDAELRNTIFSKAILCGANLCGANLYGAYFFDADLHDVKLFCANLDNAYFYNARNIPHNIPLNCPSDGAFIGWKKCGKYLIKLEIPEDAKRSSATTRKCRCDKAKVLGIYDLEGNLTDKLNIANDNYAYINYIVGETVYPDWFDEDRWNECSHGIHFFINKQDAIEY